MQFPISKVEVERKKSKSNDVCHQVPKHVSLKNIYTIIICFQFSNHALYELLRREFLDSRIKSSYSTVYNIYLI